MPTPPKANSRAYIYSQALEGGARSAVSGGLCARISRQRGMRLDFIGGGVTRLPCAPRDNKLRTCRRRRRRRRRGLSSPRASSTEFWITQLFTAARAGGDGGASAGLGNVVYTFPGSRALKLHFSRAVSRRYVQEFGKGIRCVLRYHLFRPVCTGW